MKTALLFDLDGTLLDSSGDLADSANASRSYFGLPPLSDSVILAQVGYGLGHLLRGLLPLHLHPRLLEARGAVRDHYQDHLLDRSSPYPGADRLLRRYPGPMALVTNKPARFTDPIIQDLGWSEHFELILSGDSLSQRKPHPAPLHFALEVLKARPDQALFIGDSEVDEEAAQAAGVPFLCVAWGRSKAPERLERLEALLERQL